MNTQVRMCRQSRCSKKAECYRYRAIPVAAPRVQEYGKPEGIGESCRWLIGICERPDVRSIEEIECGS